MAQGLEEEGDDPGRCVGIAVEVAVAGEEGEHCGEGAVLEVEGEVAVKRLP